MKIFLSATEQKKKLFKYLLDNKIQLKWNLISYYYAKKDLKTSELIRDNSEGLLVDSGAHSFMKGAKVRWIEYTQRYANFIKEFDRPNVLGYFEMDTDIITGYDRVLEMRKILESVSDKIIPVWHKGRGIQEYQRMCQQYQNKIVAITGFKNEDIKDEQYISFLKYAKKYNCKVHCLGMTRKAILDKVPFDFTDSSSWSQQSKLGKIEGRNKVSLYISKNHYEDIYIENYLNAMKIQQHYYQKWKAVCKD